MGQCDAPGVENRLRRVEGPQDRELSHARSKDRADALFNSPGIHVIDVGWRRTEPDDEGAAGGQLVHTVETGPGPVGCRACGVVAASHGRRLRRLRDIPAFGGACRADLRSVVGAARSPRARCCLHRGGRLDFARAKLTIRAAWWRSAASKATALRSQPWLAGWAWTGTQCGRRSRRCGRCWLITRHAWPVWRSSAWMSTSDPRPRAGKVPNS